MAFVYLKDISGEHWVLNSDMISHVMPKVKGKFEHGAAVYLKQTINGNRDAINLSGEEAQQLLQAILD
ncbi:hypothetical protein [Pseudomonas putida]|jgi:hypothetical protein|uniref:hypothetical protein n=1 Tax=Pseudomonas putida TaxID=303 RepID=UPI0023641421|nr:hypothetical protein [Pseudomonas putida]MDD2101244.1 hypothetical protein [Pseudomonas putida]